MIEFGKTLRTAREAKGFTVTQLAETTKLLSSTITDLENEDFSRIAAPIYGRGFIKLYCEAVGLDPKPLVNEFMEIIGGNREAQIRERPISGASACEPAPEPVPAPVPEPVPAPVPEPVPAPAPEPVTTTEPPAEPDSFRLESETLSVPNPPAAFSDEAKEVGDSGLVSPPEDFRADPFLRESDPEPAHGLSRYAAPVHQTHVDDRAHPSYWRLMTLAAGALAIVLLLLFGIRSLYRATSSPSAAEADEGASAAPASAAQVGSPGDADATPQPDAARAPHTVQKIPDLYID